MVVIDSYAWRHDTYFKVVADPQVDIKTHGYQQSYTGQLWNGYHNRYGDVDCIFLSVVAYERGNSNDCIDEESNLGQNDEPQRYYQTEHDFVLKLDLVEHDPYDSQIDDEEHRAYAQLNCIRNQNDLQFLNLLLDILFIFFSTHLDNYNIYSIFIVYKMI